MLLLRLQNRIRMIDCLYDRLCRILFLRLSMHIHVIDLQKTLKLIEVSYKVVKDIAARGGKVLFVGTKKQAQEAIESEAKRCGMYYINQRWLGGTLTNNITIRKSINKLKHLEKIKEEHGFDNLTKKEIAQKNNQINKLNFYLSGIKDMICAPEVMIIIDTKKEQLAIKESQKLNIPVVGIIDTNADPTEVKYPIPANDDAIRAIKLICAVLANAVLEGRKELGKKGVVDKSESEVIEEESLLDSPLETEAEENVMKESDLDLDFVDLYEEEELEQKKEKGSKPKRREKEVNEDEF